MTRRAPLAVAAVLLLAGCLTPSPDDGEPAAPVDVRLDVDLADDEFAPGTALLGEATATNAGAAGVRHYAYCQPPIELEFFAPDGERVLFDPPTARCEALTVETLEPGATKSVEFDFRGTVWDADDPDAEGRPAPPGTYTVRATFRWWTADADTPLTDVPDDVRETTAEATFEVPEGAGVAAGGPEVRVVAEPSTFGAGGATRVNATVINQGETPVWYNRMCVPPLEFRALHGGEEVQFREPVFHCLGIDLAPLGPGETLAHEVVWNGTLWRDERLVEAEPGTYTFVASFRWWSEDDADSEIRRAEGRADVAYTG